MPGTFVLGEPVDLPLQGELRYGFELARLVTDRGFLTPSRHANAPPVLLIPGFMAGDPSLALLRNWVQRRGSDTEVSGIWLNVDCSERAVRGIETRLRQLAERSQRRVVLIGQSRGGELARVVAVRNPDLVSTVVMLGSPVLAPLKVGRAVMAAVRSVARLGDLGMPGVFSSECAVGDCCAAYRDQLRAAVPGDVDAVAVYSRTDGIVSWHACLDPGALHVEVGSSHSGMSANREVYAVLAGILDSEAQRWSG
ncbi:MAG TPA: alpha/beta hydrolase [Solirubrobacteraceae bacterium]|nr:alpha/beta hydrolase [Solirubrobacteraceae bacterium]